jgi:acetylornithine deacetylase
MDVIALTRKLVDIPSISGEEEAVGEFIYSLLGEMAHPSAGSVVKMEVEPGRFNVYAQWGQEPTVTFSTHMDVVPPFFPSSEDDEYVYGRGSCDAKGIAAAMICAVERLLSDSISGLGLLFVVGEERGSAGAIEAAKHAKGAKFLINGEPTENKLALGTKGALRINITAHGKMAHSAYPELGESAIEKLLDVLERIRQIQLPVDAVLGPSTLNIGTIQAGRVPNVIPDEAKAELLIRLVGDAEPIRQQILNACKEDAEATETLCIEACHLGSLPGFDTTSVAYTTDIPLFGPVWGKPFLLGPGTIHLAHTLDERVLKSELKEAVVLYEKLARQLLARAGV